MDNGKIEPNNNNIEKDQFNNQQPQEIQNTTMQNVPGVDNILNQNSIPPSVNNQNPNTMIPKKEASGLASLILGIISVLLSWLLNIFVLPLEIIGLVLGIAVQTKDVKKKLGIILNVIAICISIISFGFFITSDEAKEVLGDLYNELDYNLSDNYIAGKYNCVDFENDDDYVITLHLNKDNSFLYGPYGDLDNNYAKGTYTFEDEQKTNPNGKYKYFLVRLSGSKENFVQHGVSLGRDFNSVIEFGITNVNGKKEGVIMFTNTYNIYYCYSE